LIARVRLASNKTTRCRACRLPLIVRLYETRDDHLPEPTRRDHATRGFIHQTDAHEACPDCLANDRTTYACETCGGRGYLVVQRDRDPYAVDKVQPYGLNTDARLEAERDRSAELERLAAQTRAPWASVKDEIAEADKPGNDYGWREARKTMCERYDYDALRVALEIVHVQHPGVPDLSPYGLAFIDARMPERIRAPRAYVAPTSVPAKGVSAGDKALKDRDRLVLDLAAKGVDYGTIAKQVGLSARQLRRVINERSTEAA
jgi:hypothetical protein